MITVWRLCKQRHSRAAFSGLGAKLYGGRWNHPGTPVVYCSGTLALATLELFVHLDPADIPDDLVAIQAQIPGPEAIEFVAIADLPDDWRDEPGPPALRDLGDRWVASRRTAVLAVPSAIVPAELNYVVNPEHPDASRISLATPEPYGWDPRLRK
jgi:RES domain-containing protein